MTNEESFNLNYAFTIGKLPQPFQPGDVCMDKQGHVGMITEEKPDEKGMWCGVHLLPDRAGEPWWSPKPKKVITTDIFVRFVRLLEEVGI